jgi:hypothetical protein
MTKEKTAIPYRSNKWSDDLLHRHAYSEFLTNYFERKCGLTQPAIVAALDAPWGLGKTFFVERWSKDLRKANRAVIFFNAWENDSTDDPTVSFMAELHTALGPLYDQLPKSTQAKLEIEEQKTKLLQSFRRAAMPVVGVLAKGIVKKLTGVAVQEVFDAIETDTTEGAKIQLEAAAGDNSKETIELLEKGLDTVFSKTIEAHTQRLKSVALFRLQLEKLLEKLHEHDATQGPFWVFIDELDRCRPDYAITLLEGIKHLFSVKGAIFVISTNLDQLSKAVGAVYGVNFDGHQYLKRFFHLEYTLPEPSRIDYLKSLTDGSVFDTLTGCSGLDQGLPRGTATHSNAISYVAEAMQLDLRSIQQIIGVVEATILGMPPNTPVATMWLFFLAATKQRHPSVFKRLAVLDTTDAQIDHKMLIQTLPKNVFIPCSRRTSDHPRQIRIFEVIAFLHLASLKTISEIAEEINSHEGVYEGRGVPYPSILNWELINFPQPNHPYSLRMYPSLLEIAGHVAV